MFFTEILLKVLRRQIFWQLTSKSKATFVQVPNLTGNAFLQYFVYKSAATAREESKKQTVTQATSKEARRQKGDRLNFQLTNELCRNELWSIFLADLARNKNNRTDRRKRSSKKHPIRCTQQQQKNKRSRERKGGREANVWTRMLSNDEREWLELCSDEICGV